MTAIFQRNEKRNGRGRGAAVCGPARSSGRRLAPGPLLPNPSPFSAGTRFVHPFALPSFFLPACFHLFVRLRTVRLGRTRVYACVARWRLNARDFSRSKIPFRWHRSSDGVSPRWSTIRYGPQFPADPTNAASFGVALRVKKAIVGW